MTRPGHPASAPAPSAGGLLSAGTDNELRYRQTRKQFQLESAELDRLSALYA